MLGFVRAAVQTCGVAVDLEPRRHRRERDGLDDRESWIRKVNGGFAAR